MSRLDEAIVFAAKVHQGQFRKGTDIPYITHPFGVALLVQQAGCDEDLVIAALLHDTVEDTNVSLPDIEHKFGERVRHLVEAASEPDKSLSWEQRKEHTLEFLSTAPLDVKYLACADKLHNLTSILADLKQEGPGFWERFNRGVDKQVWYYTSLRDSLDKNLPETDDDHPLLEDYRRAVMELHKATSDTDADS